MAGRSYLAQLREHGGAALDLLVLLDQHRVLTTDQLVRATGCPERTVRYRLTRLQEHQLVDEHRPVRATGSTPSHWWLRPAGARLVTGANPPAGGRPSHPFVAHAAAIGEAWLAVRDHGPAAGIRLLWWRTDRAGWQEWEPSAAGYGLPPRRRLTPDAVLLAEVTAGDVVGEAAVFLEIDLATMNQTQLKEKVQRYAVYAKDRAWVGTFPHCPPLLLLTRTEARAVNFVRAARRVLDSDRPRRFYAEADAVLDDADRLVVAACGLVGDPAAAVTGPVWLLPEQAAATVTLAELLAGRLTAQQRADEIRTVLEAGRRAEELIDTLRAVENRSAAALARHLGDEQAAEALHALTRSTTWLATTTGDEDELVLQVVGWWGPRAAKRHPVDEPPPGMVDELRGRYDQMWTGQVGRLLAADAWIIADDPRMAALAAALQSGRLLDPGELAQLHDIPEQRARLQDEALADYRRQVAHDARREYERLTWSARRKTSPEQIAADIDARLLLACTMCAMVVPRRDPTPDPAWDGDIEGESCGYCRAGQYAARTGPAAPILTVRLAELRVRLPR